MQCPRCQAQNAQDAKFCEDCGARLEAVCPSCGQPVGTGKKFCRSCGNSLAADPSRFTSPQAYTPKHLAEKILTSKSAIEGERKQVTVLFADLKGSTELLADRDPEDARKLLDPVLEHMMEAVHRYEGTVNQVMGDGIMALFGAPVSHEDHAVRACYAALRMQDSVKRYADGVRREYGVTVRIRVGLNSGQVVVRAIGSDLHMDYTAVGQTTHLAARMEQLADPGSILLAPDTLALVEGFVQVTSLGPMAVKGLPAPVEVHELTGVSTVRSRLQAATIRGLSRFVGRDSEIEQLRRALEQARLARGQVAAIVGEAGVGKSRLVFELTHSHRVEGWLVLEAGSVSYGKATSYLPVIELLKGYFGIGDRDTYRGIREKITGKILTLDRALEPTLPALLSLLDVPIEDPHWSAQDPPMRRQRTLDALKRLLLREAQVQPLLVVFEDLHWIDSETQALLDGLIESLPTARLLLLVNYRPEYSHGWGSKTYYMQLRLDTLPPESTEELLDALLGRDPSLHRLKNLLAETTAGNPLFLEESVRTLVETKALVGERGAYRLAQAVETVEVPATVQVILSSRIDRLPPDEKRLLETAAVIGKDFPFTLLEAIAGENEGTLRRGLDHLQAGEFLYETSLFPDLEFTFKHALTHEVVYGSLLQERRRGLHARIVEAIEALYPDRLTEHVERLAHHAFRGGQWSQAVFYLHQAGTRAFYGSAYGEAGPRFEEALIALGRLPNSRQAAEQAIDIRLGLHRVLFARGEIEQGISHLRAAESAARTLNDEGRLVRVLEGLAFMTLSNGDLKGSLTLVSEALVRAQSIEDGTLQGAIAHRILGQIQHARGEYQQARTVLRQSISLAQGLGTPDSYNRALVPAQAWLTFASADLGLFQEGEQVGEEMIEIARRTDSQGSLVGALACVGYLHLRRGSLEAAIRVLEPGRVLCRTFAIHVYGVPIGASLASAYALSGRPDEARAVLDQSRNLARSIKTTHWHSLWFVLLAEACAAAGQRQEARDLAKRALELARAQGAQGYLAYSLRTLADSHEPQEAEETEAYYHNSVRSAEELGMRPLVAHCHLGLGKLYRRMRKRQEAQEHLTIATTMYREMDMRFWLEQTEAEFGLLG